MIDALGDDGRTLVALAIDVVAIVVLSYAIYFRRHHRHDLLLALVSFNVGLFAVVTVLIRTQVSVTAGLALGIGLFGALSLIRLRSQEITYTEVAYFFSSLALAIVNGFALGSIALAGLLSVLVVVTVAVLDAFKPTGAVERLSLVLDEVIADETVLRAELERRLGGTVVGVTVAELDYVREVTRVEARYVPRRSTAPAEPEARVRARDAR